MNNFRTEIPAPKYDFNIDHQNGVFLIGSCFSDNIGRQLLKYKFNVLSNPFGTLYNPISVANSFNIALEKKHFTHSDIFEFNELWNSFYHHSSFSHPDAEICLKNINNAIEESNKALGNCRQIFITFGTSMVYEHIQSGRVVSNCHKIPQKEFRRYRLETEEIVDAYKTLIQRLNKSAPNVKIIFTVSPIRHWKDGAHENQVNKSVLFIAIEKICKKYASCFYFPSYEFLMDDLRDYRFYETDMLHPSAQAIEYVWSKFSESFFTLETSNLNKKIEKLLKAVNHRPVNQESISYQQFVQSNLNIIADISEYYPFINLNNEKSKLHARIFKK